ncbi:DUF7507 domain-containing protein [Pseudomonas shirazensis]
MSPKTFLRIRSLFLKTLTVLVFLIPFKMLSQNTITRIHTDWNGYWTSNSTTGVGNRPDTANNLLAFAWNGVTYSTGVNDNTLSTNAVTFNPQKFRALKIQTLGLNTSMYFLQGSMIDGSASTAKLVPALAGSTATGAELASRLTDGTNGLTLGTGMANITAGVADFKIGTNNLNIAGVGDGIPDIIVTQVAEPGNSQFDTFKFINAAGATVGTEISIKFDAVTAIGTYSLDLFRADNGVMAFTPAATRDIRMLGIEASSFGINASNASQVDRFVVTFSGNSDCAFIAFNTKSLKIAELGLVKKASIIGCGKLGDVINYTFEVTNTGEVPITDIRVTDPMPGLVISGNPIASLAAGAKATLTGTYTITAADVAAGKVVNSAKVTGTDPSFNTIEDISGQTNTDNIATTTVLSIQPTFTAQPTASTCIGTSVTYTTESGMTNYIWTFPGTAGTNYTIVSGGTTASNTVTLRYLTAGSKTVTVNYTNANGCTATASTSSSAITVNVLPAPTFTAQPTASTCIGTSVTYTTESGMTNYIWTFPGTAGTNYTIDAGGTTASNTVTLRYLTTGSKTVTVNYTNANGCTATAATSSSAITVNVLPAPTFTVQPTASTCIGTAVTYTTESGMTNYVWTFPGTAGTNYVIDAGGTTASNTVTLRYLTAGSKTVAVNYTNANGCTATAATSSSAITVNALPAPTFTAQPTASTCIGTAVTYTTESGMTNYVWTFPGTAGTNYTIVSGGTTASNTVTLRYLTAGSKTVTVNYTNANGCTATAATSSSAITVNPLPSTPTVSTTNVSCTATGSVTLGNLPASGTWTLERSPGLITTTGTGTTTTITGLAVGTYTFRVSNGTCSSAVSADAVITDQSSTTWNGSSWSPAAPDATRAAIIAGPFTVSADLTACSLTINSGIDIVVPSNFTLKIINGLTVSPTSKLTFENHSSLVQVNNNAVNSGKITYKRTAVQIRQADYTYWSTPVSPQRLIDVSPASSYNKFFGYSGTAWVATYPTGNMVVGKGYIIRGPDTFSNSAKADYTASFSGVPNNGILTGETMQADKFYLIGNPYPSALDADTFIDENRFLEGTLYFWTHNTPVVLSAAYRYSSTDYASYNLTGGVGSQPAPSGNPSNNDDKPSGFIGAGQSFFASAATPGTITFNNGMRLGATQNTQFFKSASKAAKIEKHRIWLNITNTEGAFKQMLVGYVQGASNEYEARYDGVSFDANPYIDFYSVANGNNYVIQARALPFANTDLVPLGYRTTIAGEFTIAIDQTDGDLKNQAIYLEDKTTGVIYDLTKGDYKFTTAKGTFSDRFVLRYTNKTLGTGDFEDTQNGLLVSVKQKTIKITSSIENIQEVTIYDVAGKMLYNKNKAATTELQIQNLPSANQVLLVKITLENNFTTTKKIIFN